MEKVIIREIEAKDIQQIKAVIGEVWDWETFIEDKVALDSTFGMYFNTVIEGATFGRVAIVDNEVLGVIFGIFEGESPKYQHLKDNYKLPTTEQGLAQLEGVKGYFTKLNAAYDELIQGKKADFDGTLDFLVLSPRAQGLGVGKKLWLSLKAYFEEKQAKSIYLYSDNECNYGFYEHLGFDRANEIEVEFEIEDEGWDSTQFLFTYKL